MFSNSVKLFTLNRFDIKVDPSWLIIAALITWSLSQGYFPQALPGQSSPTYLTMAVIAMLGLFLSLLLHELAHSVVARHLGVPIKGITLFLFGGVAELDAEPKSARDEFWIAVAGPAMSISLSFGFWVLTESAQISALPQTVLMVLSYLALINLVLAIFNLIPAFPLDGGRVLRAYLWQRSGDVLAATKTAALSGTFVAYILMVLGVMALFHGAFLSGFWQIMIGGFVLAAARAEYGAQLAKVAFQDISVSGLMTRNPVTVGPEMSLATFVNQIMLGHGISFVPVVEDGVLLGHVDQSVISKIDRENWINTQVGDVFVGLQNDVMIAPDMAVRDLLGMISRTGRRKFMVMSDRRLLGVITLSDLARHLHTNQTGDAGHAAKAR